MHIVCLVKQVPDTTEIKIDKETNTLIRAGVMSIINPNDLAGVEEALKIKEKTGAKVSVVTMGPPQAESMLVELYARGVDQCYLLTDRAFAGSDTWATSKILSSFIKSLDFDLIIAGYQAIDGDTAQVGPQVAEFLDIPQVTYIQEIVETTNTHVIIKKKTDHDVLTLKVELPCLTTALADMNKPRLMNAFDIMNNTDKPVTKVGFSDINVAIEEIGLKGSPTKVKKTYVKQVEAKSEKQVMTPEDAAKRIAKLLYPYMEVENA
ncbi:electron transfer flavoprotein beta subunit [Acholeplasma morum]|jgi:electron transfer flavoprotein beta subunit|uniref:electron transfer flavoprotein subunit beta/FixA family protein n=1 Tax=Paracholeplasma morum TaxID=264637 RepID=UPI00195E1196|nr:electron transfer flavoprotein subunit beta/FixA family protein [Paracholeplasma morum]MBM7454040.1 electron transfer flavoprotein beta subunit [Paracholeplasma morum]